MNPEVAALILEFRDRYSLHFVPVNGKMAAEVAAANNGLFQIACPGLVPWPSEFVGGRFEPWNVLILDIDAPPHQQMAIALHEIGHADYCDGIAKTQYVELDSELHAQRFAFRELTARGLKDALRFFVDEIDRQFQPNMTSHPALVEANRKFMATEEWRAAKQFLAASGS